MKKLIAVLSAMAFLGIFFAQSAEADYTIWRKTVPTGLAKLVKENYVAAKFLSPRVNPTKVPPVEIVKIIPPEDAEKSATIVLETGEWPNNLINYGRVYVGPGEILFAKPPAVGETGFLTTEEIFVDSGGTVLLPMRGGIRSQNVKIGREGGELAQVLGIGWTINPLSKAIVIIGPNAEITDAVIADNYLAVLISPWTKRVDIKSSYIISNRNGLERPTYDLPAGAAPVDTTTPLVLTVQNSLFEQKRLRPYDLDNHYINDWDTSQKDIYASAKYRIRFQAVGSVFKTGIALSSEGVNPPENEFSFLDCETPVEKPEIVKFDTVGSVVLDYHWSNRFSVNKGINLTIQRTRPGEKILGQNTVQFWPRSLDFSGNGKNGEVGLEDVLFLASEFGFKTGDTPFTDLYDNNRNGVVDFDDFMTVVRQHTGLWWDITLADLTDNPKVEPMIKALADYPAVIEAAKADPQFGPIIEQVLNMTAVLEEAAVPGRFALHQNFPNPFNSQTVIRFAVSEPGQTVLTVYNLAGQLVRTLEDGYMQAGVWATFWDGKDDSGRDAASGIYLYQLRTSDQVLVRRMLLVR